MYLYCFFSGIFIPWGFVRGFRTSHTVVHVCHAKCLVDWTRYVRKRRSHCFALSYLSSYIFSWIEDVSCLIKTYLESPTMSGTGSIWARRDQRK